MPRVNDWQALDDRAERVEREDWERRGGDPDASIEDIRAARLADETHERQYGCWCCCPCHNRED